MKKIFLAVFIMAVTNFAQANYLDNNLRKKNWSGIDIVWLEDDSLPTYDVVFYFQDGAYSESKRKAGETSLMFAQLTSGTNRFNQNYILESLEFYGASYGSHVTHEYSTFSVSGLTKDFGPTLKMVCHLFSNATFPKSELRKAKKRIISGFKSMVANHSQLANHIFRAESMKGSGFDTPTTGSISSIRRLRSKDLSNRLTHFNQNVSKRIYIKGPGKVLELQNIIKNDCGWKQDAQKKVSDAKVKKVKNPGMIFIPIKNANQAQIRIGRIINQNEISFEKSELKGLASKYMGGGFTSQLVQRLRVDKGLTYSAGAYASEQKTYGRGGISTFTKNESIIEMLKSIKEVVDENSSKILEDSLALLKKSAKGQYLLGLESTSSFLETLLYYDHIGRDYEDIYKYGKIIDLVSTTDLKKMIDELYGWKKQTILILGNPKLKQTLKKAGYKFKVKKYNKYL